MKIFIAVDHQDLIRSRLLNVKFTIKEIGDPTKTWMFFNDFPFSSISNEQNEYESDPPESLQSQQIRLGEYDESSEEDEEDDDDFDWRTRNDLSFDVSITLTFHGKFNRLEHQIKRIMNAGKTWNPVESLLETGKFADFTFIVRGRKFEVHKCILSAASEVLNTMFTCGLNETKNNVATIDYEPEIFKHFLSFVYTKVAPDDVMPKICVQLYDIAHSYGVELLEKICKAYIVEMAIDADNAQEMYEFAATYGVSEVLGKSWEFIKT